MVFKSSSQYSTHEILKTLTAVGGSYNAITDHDVTYYYIQTTSEGTKWKDALHLMTSMIFSPKIIEKEWELEKQVVLQEISIKDTVKCITSLCNHRNSYVRPIGGTKATVNNIEASDLIEFHKRYYLDPSRVKIVISCNKNMHAQVRQALNHLDIPLMLSTEPDPIVNVGLKPRVVFDRTKSQNTEVTLVFSTYDVREWRKLIALNFLNYILTRASLYSVLMYELRETRGLIYTISSATLTFDKLSLCMMMFSTKNPDRTIDIIKIIKRVLTSIKKGGLDSAKFRLFKDSYLNTVKYLVTKQDYFFMLSAFNFHYGVETIDQQTFFECISSLTNKDIQSAAIDTYNFKNMGLYIEGNTKGIDRRQLKLIYAKKV